MGAAAAAVTMTMTTTSGVATGVDIVIYTPQNQPK